MHSIYLKQNKLCALTGHPINFSRIYSKKQIASLDRIDSNKGYIENNVQWVHKDINKLKTDFNSDTFLKLCYMVTDYTRSLQ